MSSNKVKVAVRVRPFNRRGEQRESAINIKRVSPQSAVIVVVRDVPLLSLISRARIKGRDDPDSSPFINANQSHVIIV